jgi:peptide/nickel transport system substrate-binding protein
MGARMKRRAIYQVVSIATAIIAVAMALPVQAETFRWSHQADAISMDPYSVNETMTLGFVANVYEGLVRRSKDFKIEPALATEWSNPAADIWRFKLRKGVKFHDGSPFTADDVVFSYKRINSEGSDLKAYVSGIKEIKKLDDYTIDIITNGPRPILISDISRWYIMSKSWGEKHKTTTVGKLSTGEETYATRHANGTGPFMLKLRQPDVKTIFVPNPNWWDKPTHNVTEAIFTPIKSQATRVASLLSGELDMMYPVPLQDIGRVNHASNLEVLRGPELRSVFFGLDVFRDELLYSNVKGKNPLKDLRVRKAMYQAIDVEAIQKKVMRGASYITAFLIGPGVNGFDPKLNVRFPYDPKASRQLLAEAGYPNGFEITLDCFNDRVVNDEAICQAVTAMLAKVGIKVSFNSMPKAKYIPKIKALDTSFYMLSWTPSNIDMYETYFYNVMCPKWVRKDRQSGEGAWNFGGYCDPAVDALMDSIAVELDPTKRQSMIEKVLLTTKEAIGHIPIHQQTLAWGVKKNISLAQNPDNSFSLQFVNIK